jgi:hypothetical protein
MNKWKITAHVAIICLSALVGSLTQRSYIVYCLYSSPACESPGSYLTFAVGFLMTVGILYGVWVSGFIATRVFRRTRF